MFILISHPLKLSRLLTAYLPHATEFQFQIKLFRVLSSDAEKMLMSPKTLFECPQPGYSPLIEMTIPGTSKKQGPRGYCTFQHAEAMKDRKVVYWHVRTLLIMVYKFTKLPLQDIQDHPEILYGQEREIPSRRLTSYLMVQIIIVQRSSFRYSYDT